MCCMSAGEPGKASDIIASMKALGPGAGIVCVSGGGMRDIGSNLRVHTVKNLEL